MREIVRLRRVSLGTLLFATVLLAGSLTTLHSQSPLQVIASGLDNPRGLAFGPDGALYVAEAGRGGTSSLCLPQPDGPGIRCYGPSGAVTRILGIGNHRRVVVGLPSMGGPTGDQSTGPQDIDFGMGSAWVTVGFGGHPASREALEAAGVRMGRLVRIQSNGQWTDVVDIAAHEAANNPDGTTVDSNPFGLRIMSDHALVADAGANALLRISATGAISTLGVFPRRTVTTPAGPVSFDSVPTGVVAGRDGNVYVGELTGFPFLVGAARVYRVPAAGGTPTVVASGFTNIIDVVFDASGVGYVLEHDADGIVPPLGPGVNGRLIRVAASGAQTVIASAGLVKPGGMTMGPDGAIYVTTFSASAGAGQVVRIVP